MFPVLGREVVESKQRVSILAQAIGGLLVFQRVALDEGVERQFGSNLGFGHPDLLQRSFGFRLLAFRQLASTFAVLCTQQRCSRVFGQTSPAAFQNPSAPSAITSCGGTLSPRRLRSSSRSRQSCAFSRAPSVKPTSSLRPSGVAPISTRMHCFSSSSRASRWMPSAQM